MSFSRADRLSSKIIWVNRGLLLLLVIEFVSLLFLRRVNLDEGWYLGAGKLVYAGKLLYRDFAYTQTPLLPYIYGFFQQIVGTGLYQGRLLTILFALGACGFSSASARKLGGDRAQLICLTFWITSVFALTQYTYTATYALTACLLTAALDVSLRPWLESRRNGVAVLLAILAIGVRLSAIAALPPFLFYLILTSQQRKRATLVVILVSAITLCCIFVPFWFVSGELMRYDIFGFHMDRILRVQWQLLKVQQRLLRTLTDFGVLIFLCGWAAVWASTRLRREGWFAVWRDTERPGGIPTPDRGNEQSYVGVILAMVFMIGGLFAAHLIPRTTDSYYNALQMPVMCTLAGVVLSRGGLPLSSGRGLRQSWLLIILALCHGGLQARAMGRDGPLNKPLLNQIAVVQEAAQLLQRYTQPGDRLLSFNQHLALETDLQTPPGYEMAIFAYRPTWSTEQARQHKVINNELLLQDLAAGMDAVAFTAFDLEMIYGERERFFQILQEDYRWFYTIEQFGPYGDELRLYFPPQFEPPTPKVELASSLEEGIRLLGYDLIQQPGNSPAHYRLGLYWQATQPITRSYTVFVQLLDETGAFAAGWDNPPCQRTCPTESWQRGEFVRDEHLVVLEGRTPGAVYTLQTGMYDSATTQRLKVGTNAGQPPSDRIILTTVP